MGNTIVQSASGVGSKGVLLRLPEDEDGLEVALTKAVRDQMVRDLVGVLGRLDALELWQAGAHLSSAIETIQDEAVVDDLLPLNPSF